jgi:hypothetical protein
MLTIPNLSVNNGSPDWGLHRFNDGVVFHCAKNSHGFWTAIGPAKKLVEPIKLELGKLEIEDCACRFRAQDKMHDKLELIMSIHQPIIIDGDPMPQSRTTGQKGKSKGGLVKKTSKTSKPTKTVKKAVKKTAKKSKKS